MNKKIYIEYPGNPVERGGSKMHPVSRPAASCQHAVLMYKCWGYGMGCFKVYVPLFLHKSWKVERKPMKRWMFTCGLHRPGEWVPKVYIRNLFLYASRNIPPILATRYQSHWVSSVHWVCQVTFKWPVNVCRVTFKWDRVTVVCPLSDLRETFHSTDAWWSLKGHSTNTRWSLDVTKRSLDGHSASLDGHSTDTQHSVELVVYMPMGTCWLSVLHDLIIWLSINHLAFYHQCCFFVYIHGDNPDNPTNTDMRALLEKIASEGWWNHNFCNGLTLIKNRHCPFRVPCNTFPLLQSNPKLFIMFIFMWLSFSACIAPKNLKVRLAKT